VSGQFDLHTCPVVVAVRSSGQGDGANRRSDARHIGLWRLGSRGRGSVLLLGSGVDGALAPPTSPRAAMIYLHVSKGRSRHIADKLSIRLRDARPKGDED
jgi:hypothetical protein